MWLTSRKLDRSIWSLPGTSLVLLPQTRLGRLVFSSKSDRVLCTALVAGWLGRWLAVQPPPP